MKKVETVISTGAHRELLYWKELHTCTQRIRACLPGLSVKMGWSSWSDLGKDIPFLPPSVTPHWLSSPIPSLQHQTPPTEIYLDLPLSPPLNLTVLVPRAHHAPACFSLLPATPSFTLGLPGERLFVLDSAQMSCLTRCFPVSPPLQISWLGIHRQL